jgi:uncharacterized protein YprB with RNaseH-like and TPR domain
MLSDQLKRHLSDLRRSERSPRPAVPRRPSAPSSALSECFPEGAFRGGPRGEVFVCQASLGQICTDGYELVRRYLSVFPAAAELAAQGSLPDYLQPLSDASPSVTALIDTETAGWHGRPLFLVGLVRQEVDDLVVTQYFACDYSQEAAVLAKLAEELPELRLLVSFNGKAFDWPFVRDRMAYHRIPRPADIPHLDLLHPSRRRWRAQLPNCKLQTLERYLCGRWRSGDVPSAEIPQRYHDFVREQDARLIAPIFHHNRMDLITMVELLIALVSGQRLHDRARSGGSQP